MGVGTFGTDYVKNISYSQNSTITMDITDISEIVNGEVIVGMFVGSNTNNAAIAQAYASFSSRTGGNTPTLTVTYEDYVPQAPYNLTPNATVRNKNGGIYLAWEYSDNGTGVIQAICGSYLFSTDGFATSTTQLDTSKSIKLQ